MDARNAKYVRLAVERDCGQCGAHFSVEGFAAYKQRFCSPSCRRKHTRLLRGEPRADHRQRARQLGLDYEPGLTWKRLLDEDGPACWICGRDVDPTDKRKTAKSVVVGLEYPSIDHVIPAALGGHHVRSNVRLAHMRCNSSKKARLLAA